MRKRKSFLVTSLVAAVVGFVGFAYVAQPDAPRVGLAAQASSINNGVSLRSQNIEQLSKKENFKEDLSFWLPILAWGNVLYVIWWIKSDKREKQR